MTGSVYYNIPEATLLVGVYQPNSPGSYGMIDSFAAQAGFTPRITSYYSTFQMPFAAGFAKAAAQRGTTVLVQWQPRGTTNAAVAAAQDDSYIWQFARDVESVNHQVIISYGQEMNGNWYNWGTNGAGNSNPADYLAAYRHVWTFSTRRASATSRGCGIRTSATREARRSSRYIPATNM